MMIKTLLLSAGVILCFGSCGSNDKSQAQFRQIDSLVSVKVHQREVENAAKNDSTLKAIETEKADAIIRQRNESAKTIKKTDTSIHQPDTSDK